MNRLAAFLVVAALLPTVGAADQRSYTFTYQPLTSPKGGLDVELYTTFVDPTDGSARGRGWQHQIELEYGITDSWDVALYNVFRRPYGAELEYEAVKLRSRYRLTEPGASLVDTVLYVEAKRSFVDERPTSFEEKLIVGKDFGRANLALNLVAEQELVAGATELEWGFAAGASWEFSPSFRLGAETFGDVKEATTPGGDELVLEAWAGPAVSVSLPLRAGVLQGGWLALTAGVGLTPDSDDLRLRAILAFAF
jgi:hypothetical protein